MPWVKDAIHNIKNGQAAHVRPHGGSMRGRIESGQLVTIEPITFEDIQIDDVIFVRWKGNYLLHIAKEISDGRVLIGNNIGKINGWIDGKHVLGKVTAISAM